MRGASMVGVKTLSLETEIVLTGGCHCGQVRYIVTGSVSQETNCHCSICRRTSGAPYVAWFTARRTQFQLTRGEPTRYASSPKGSRRFCGACGTQLTFEHADFTDEIDITTCSLDDPQLLPPKDHTRTSSKLSWVILCDQLPRYSEARGDE